mgnify:CR=1 FL=1
MIGAYVRYWRVESMARSGSGVCVTFDLWETIIMDDPEKDLLRRKMRCEGLRRVLSGCGIELPLKKLLKGYDESVGWFQTFWKRNQDLPTIDQIRYIVKTASEGTIGLPTEPEDIKELQEAYVSPVLSVPPVLNQEAASTLQAMRNRVHRIGLISNTGRSPGRTLRQLLDKFGIFDFFDATVFSDEVGWLKPDQRIFTAAAEKLGIEIGKIIHIGDDLERDVWGAKQAGMRALLFEYDVPEEFRRQPGSLFALSRATRTIKDSEISPDGRIRSLREALQFID